MTITYSNDRLMDVMSRWSLTGVHAGVILVDETDTDGDVSRDRAGRHRLQAALLVRATGFGFPVFLVAYGTIGAHGQVHAFAGGLGAELDAAIPGASSVYEKGPLETNGFDNVALAPAMAGITDVVIMGQSVNACCAATARGAAKSGKNVHTCRSVIRGGGHVPTADPEYFGGIVGWPDLTTVYAAL